MANAEARAAVLTLQSRGMSLKGIGQALGIDSGAVSQIALGKRGAGYGSRYVGALGEMVQAGRVETPPAKRLTKAGVPARVRQPRQKVEGGTVYEIRTPAAAAHRLDAAGGQMVKVTVTFGKIGRYHGRKGMVSGNSVSLPAMSAAEMRQRLGGDAAGNWARLAAREAGIDQARGLMDVNVVVMDSQ